MTEAEVEELRVSIHMGKAYPRLIAVESAVEELRTMRRSDAQRIEWTENLAIKLQSRVELLEAVQRQGATPDAEHVKRIEKLENAAVALTAQVHSNAIQSVQWARIDTDHGNRLTAVEDKLADYRRAAVIDAETLLARIDMLEMAAKQCVVVDRAQNSMLGGEPMPGTGVVWRNGEAYCSGKCAAVGDRRAAQKKDDGLPLQWTARLRTLIEAVEKVGAKWSDPETDGGQFSVRLLELTVLAAKLKETLP